MSMSDVTYYELYRKEYTPAWVKSERYEYCEPFQSGLMTDRPASKKSFISLLLSALTQI